MDAQLYSTSSSNGDNLNNHKVSLFPISTLLLFSLDGILIRCSYNGTDVPHSVKISFDARPANDSVTLSVRDAPAAILRNSSIAACLAPLHRVDRTTGLRLMEWFELNQLLGIEHFVVYNYSCTNRMVNRLLRHYVKRGIIEVVNWNPLVPIDTKGGWPPSPHRLHYFGQVVAENDCMYRLMHRYRWVQFIDYDEYLVPRNGNQTLKDLMISVADHKADMYMFRQINFDLRFENYSATLDEVQRPVMYTQLYTQRYPTPYGTFHQSKLIIEPARNGDTMLVHTLFRFIKQNAPLSLAGYFIFDPKVALMHHYRFSRLKGRGKTKPRPVRDETTKRFRKQLLKRLNQLQIDLTE